MTLSTETLLQIAYRYYPRLGDALYRLTAQEYDELYQSSPEYLALLAKQKEAIEDRVQWKAFLVTLEEALPRYPLMDFTRGYHDVCYTARIRLSSDDSMAPTRGVLNKELVVSVSFLAPLYILYESHWYETGTREEPEYEPGRTLLEPTAEYMPVVHILERKLAQLFGYERLEPRIGATVVPGIQVGNLEPGKASLMDALFTDHRW